MPDKTPLKPEDDEKGVIFRDTDYEQLHALRVQTGAPTYKDAAMQAIRFANAAQLAENHSSDPSDQVQPFLAQASHVARDTVSEAAGDVIGLTLTLVRRMVGDHDGGQARLERLREDGYSAAVGMPCQGQANLEVEQ